MKKMKTMRTNRSRLLTFLGAAVMLVMLSINAYAAQSNVATQEGLTAQVFTDKDSYKEKESVNVSVRVDNRTGKDVFIRTEVEVPEGVTLANESAVYDAVLQDGQTWTTSGGGASAEATGNVPATGDTAKAGVWIVLAAFAVGGIALFVYGRNKKTWLSMLLCLAMVGGLVTTALPVQAADIFGSMEVSCTIQVNGKDAEVLATISYVIYDDEEEAEVSKETIESSELDDSGEATDSSKESQESNESMAEESSSAEEGIESSEKDVESTEEGDEPTEEGDESTEEGDESTENGGESTEESDGSTGEDSKSTEESGDISGGDADVSLDEGEVIYKLTFDELSSFTKNSDYVCAGGYAGNVTLTTEVDHTTGSGQALKLAGRQLYYHRVKIKDVFANAELGETYLLSAWVYSPTAADSVYIGAHDERSGSDYANPVEYKEYDIEADTWTKIEVVYKHEEENVTQLGIAQWKTAETVAETLYLDDVTITKIEAEDIEDETLVPVTLREGKRPTPNVTDTGKGYEDLIFYERTFEEQPTSEEMFNSLPANPVVMADNNNMLNALFVGPEYGQVEQIEVEDMPFSTALRAKVNTVPANGYDIQLELDSLDSKMFENGDSMLIVFYMRTISVNNEANMGQVQLIVEQEVAPNRKILQENVKTIGGSEWKKVYLPFTAQDGYTRLCIRLGYYVQTVEIGGYEILNYGTDVEFGDLPSDTVMDTYDKKELFTKDVDWRIEAWNRIETIRKGDINVIVKDEEGNVIPDADVTVDMYDHEFKWGTAVNSNINKTGETYDTYREALATFFNTAVSENDHKLAKYLNDPTLARNQVDAAKSIGLKYFRGHALIWDKGLSATYNAETNEWISNNAVPEELMRLELSHNEAAINEYIEHEVIENITGEFAGELCDWDVVNETLIYNELRSTYGIEMMKKWYEWAQTYDTTANMYINETSITGVPENGKLKAFKEVLDEMVANNIDFDGIGIQGHFGAFVSPKAFYDELCELAEYGKEMKITEFDCTLDMHLKDEEAEASFVRDILILAYSMEEMDGFLMWGFSDASHWGKNAVLFDEDWNLKLSGKQFMDLVYNKWWTLETGKTGADGTYTVKGYYGDYLITATADGKTATVDVQCYKGDGNGNTIEIILKDSNDDITSGDNSDSSENDDVTSGDNSGSSENENEVVFQLTFDDLSNFEKNTDFIYAGGYAGNVILTTEVDHTTSSGKALKLAGRQLYYHRVKLKDVFADAELGETYLLSAWVYSPTAAQSVYIGAHDERTGSSYANPVVYKEYDIDANTWTKIEVEYKHEDENVTQLGFAQWKTAESVAETLYLDDITITKKVSAQ